MVSSSLPFQDSGPLGNRRGRSPAEYRGNLYFYTSISTSVPPPPQRLGQATQKLAQASEALVQASQGLPQASQRLAQASQSLAQNFQIMA